MACSPDFIDFVCKQIEEVGVIRARKMFGDYCIYVDEKPIMLACDNIVYIKKHKAIEEVMAEAEVGFPTMARKNIISLILSIVRMLCP